MMFKKILLALVLLVALGTAIALVVPRTPTVPSAGDRPGSQHPGEEFGAQPAAAAGKCKSGSDLQRQIDDASDGTVLSLSGTYCLEERITIAGKDGLVLDGGGRSTLRQEADHTDKMFLVDRAKNITFRGLEIAGSSPSAGNRPGAYNPETASAAAIAVKGTDGVVVEETFIHDVYGDFIDLDRGPDRTVTRNVEIRNNRFERNGRQAISLGVFVEDVMIAENTIIDVRRSVFDLEPPVEDSVIRRVEIRDNNIDNFRNFVLAIGPKGVVEKVRFQGNKIMAEGGDNGGRGMVHVPDRGAGTPPVTDLVVCDNTGDLVDDNNDVGALEPEFTCDGD